MLNPGGYSTSLQTWAATTSDSNLNLVAGALSGFTSGVLTCPFDVIKTRLQAQGRYFPVTLSAAKQSHRHKLYLGFLGTSRRIWKNEGIRGMYRGLGPMLLGYLPTWAIWFSVYEWSKTELHKAQTFEKPVFVHFWASITAAGASNFATNPMRVIRTRLMAQSYRRFRSSTSQSSGRRARRRLRDTRARSYWHYRSTLDAARKIYAVEGLPAFYAGLGATQLGLIHVGIQFPAYEYLKVKFTGRNMGDAGAPSDSYGVLCASTVSKMLAGSITYPYEVVRTRLQAQRRPVPGAEFMQVLGGLSGRHAHSIDASLLRPKYRGLFHTFAAIFREEGWRALYAGLGTNLIRTVPSATVTMMTYEYVMSLLLHQRNKAVERAIDEILFEQ